MYVLIAILLITLDLFLLLFFFSLDEKKLKIPIIVYVERIYIGYGWRCKSIRDVGTSLWHVGVTVWEPG